MAIGPWGLGLVSEPSQMLHFAEFGVVLMLFLVGLELEPRRLWAMRRPIFGWGGVQLLGCGAADRGRGAGGRRRAGRWRWSPALGLALSSTAIGLRMLAERNLHGTTAGGQSVLVVALLQDIAAMPILGAGAAARRAAPSDADGASALDGAAKVGRR